MELVWRRCKQLQLLHYYVVLIIVHGVLKVCHGIPFDNGVIGNPTIVCGPNSIIIDIATRRPFEGNIFAKGHYNKAECKSRGGHTHINNLSFTMSLTQSRCGVRRIRELNPRGMAIEATIVISFHPMFITKVDRAYRVSCFYMEATKTAIVGLDVSMLTPVIIGSQPQMPDCHYEILQGAISGPRLHYARLGDAVYHNWSCRSANIGMFCMRVHTCTVDNGSDSEAVPVIDRYGCATDKYLLQDIDYLSDLMAGQEAHVFKFADKPMLYFNCKIEIKMKEHGSCDHMHPRCPPLLSGRRQRRHLTNIISEPATINVTSPFFSAQVSRDESDSLDLPPQQLTVLDIDDTNNRNTPGDTDGSSVLPFDPSSRNNYDMKVSSPQAVCLTPMAFATYVAALGILGALTISVLVGSVVRCRTKAGRSDQDGESRNYFCDICCPAGSHYH